MTSLHGRIVAVIVFLAANAVMLLDCARADVQYFPIPVVSTSKNDGSDAGLIVPILFTDPDGDLRYIVAPMLINNSYLGARGTLNIFRYDSGGREIRFIGSYTEQIERKVAFSYADPAFSQGRYSLNFGASFFKDATARFFGLGQATSESAETNYTGRETRVNWRFGVHVNEVTQIAVGQRATCVCREAGSNCLLRATSSPPSTAFKARRSFSETVRRSITTRGTTSLHPLMGWPSRPMRR
jgi:hypothetical protein